MFVDTFELVSPRPTVIVSPHCDDAVLSLGAWIAAATEAGRRVRLVTVFGNATEDTSREVARWDQRAGFATAVEGSLVRRREEAAAGGLLGAEFVVLPFPDSSYVVGERDESLVLEALAPHLLDAAEVFVPGFPLIHRDHRWLSHLDFAQLGSFTTRFYVEQPYARWNRSTSPNGIDITPAPMKLRHLRRKLAAIRCYRSQVPLLGGWRLFAGAAANDLFGPGEGFCRRSDAQAAELAHPPEETSRALSNPT